MPVRVLRGSARAAVSRYRSPRKYAARASLRAMVFPPDSSRHAPHSLSVHLYGEAFWNAAKNLLQNEALDKRPIASFDASVIVYLYRHARWRASWFIVTESCLISTRRIDAQAAFGFRGVLVRLAVPRIGGARPSLLSRAVARLRWSEA